MKCSNNPDNEATRKCNRCGKNICQQCCTIIKDEVYCHDCAQSKPINAKSPDNHSPVLAVVLSAIFSGLGQIYNGQVGKGVLLFFTGWLIIPWVIGIFDAYKVAKRIKKGEISFKPRTGCLIIFAIISISMVFIIFFLAILVAIVIPKIQ